MADTAIIGALRVILGADTASFETGLKKAQGQSESFARSVTKIMTGIGLERLLEKGVTELIGGFKEAIARADDLGKAASKVGLSVEDFTALKVAADLSDVSMESLSAGLGKLSKAMLDVARGGGDEAFKQLNIEVTKADGSMRSVREVFAEVAGKFEGMNDGALKTATALAIFGKGGKDLVPLLNEGKGELVEWTAAAQRMGLVISKDTAAQSQRFNDNLKLLQLAGQGLANTVVAAVLPALVRLSDQWVDTAKKGDTMRLAADNITGAIKQLVFGGFAAVELNKLLGQSFVALQEAVTSFPDVQKSSAAIEKFREVWGSIEPTLKRLRIEVDKLFEGMGGENAPKPDPAVVGAIGKAIEGLAFKSDVLGQKWSGLAEGFPELAKGLGVPIDQIATSVGALSEPLQKLNDAQLAFKGAQLTQDNLTPWQQYEQQLARINQLYAANAISADTAARASKKAAESTGIAWEIATQGIAGNLASGFKAFAAQNKSFALAAKAAAIVQATISTYVAAAKALELGPILGPIAAAAQTLAGLGMVAQIKAQEFAAGGAFKIPGGMSMTDNAFVPLHLAAGEMVEITPANEVARDGGSSGGGVEVTVRGFTAREFFTGEQVRDVFDGLNAAMRDGYRLKFVD